MVISINLDRTQRGLTITHNNEIKSFCQKLSDLIGHSSNTSGKTTTYVTNQ